VSAYEITDDAAIGSIARGMKRVAVLGIKTEAQREQPAFYVPAYLQQHGVEVVPVPVYYPNVTEILGRPVVRDLKQVGPVDTVIVFRRSQDVLPHVDDLLTLHPKTVWMQLGIANAEATARLTAAGIAVVQDRCAMVEHRRAR
jgi:predicted CoA-binding protein